MSEALKDKVAVVTGAGRGIGRGIALLFAQEGAKVVVNDVGAELSGAGESRSVADQVVGEIRDQGGDAVASYDSVTTMEGGESIVKAAVDHFGRLDIVATPAGILRDRMVYNMTEEEWDAVIAVHLKGTFSVVRAASQEFRQQRSGRIITFSSESGLTGNPGQANYGAAKGGVSGLTKVVARDMGRYGVTANCIVPRANTRMTAPAAQASLEFVQRFRIRALEEMFAGVEQWDPDDVAPMVAYLASDMAANVNGQFFLVYGGTIALLSQPRPVRTLFKDGQWTTDELWEAVPRDLVYDLPNPAPPEAPAK